MRQYYGKIGYKYYDISDMSLLGMAISTIAFHDNTVLLVCMQMLFVGVQYSRLLHNNWKCTISLPLLTYLCWGFSFALYALASYCWADYRKTVFSCAASIIQVVLISSALIIYCSSEIQYKKAVRYFTIAAIILCIRMLCSTPFSAWGSERVGQYIGYGNVTVTYSLSYIAIYTFYEGIRQKKTHYIVSSTIMTLFSALSGSKKSLIIAGLALVLIVIICSQNRKKLIRNCFLIIVVLIIGIVCVYKIPMLYGAIGRRFDSMFDQLMGTGSDASTRDRVLLIQYAQETFKESPIFGIGLDAFRYSNVIGRTAHNNYWELLSCLGIVGFCLYYSFVGRLLFQCAKQTLVYHKKQYCIGFVVLVCILAMDIASESYSKEPIQLAVALAYCHYNLERKKGTMQEQEK